MTTVLSVWRLRSLADFYLIFVLMSVLTSGVSGWFEMVSRDCLEVANETFSVIWVVESGLTLVRML